jgi:putative ABC transport system permease protein
MRRRRYEAVLCKVCGASRRQVLAMLLAENAFLGVLAGLTALGLGAALSFAFVTSFMELPFRFFPGPAVAAVGIAAGLTLVLGLAGVLRALSDKAWPYLRNE